MQDGHAATLDQAGWRQLIHDLRRAMSVTAPAMDNAEPILRLRGVGRRFGGVQAVRGVDLDVFPGERRAILGPNGAGKTTLFNLVSGEFPPTAGQIDLFGRVRSAVSRTGSRRTRAQRDPASSDRSSNSSPR